MRRNLQAVLNLALQNKDHDLLQKVVETDFVVTEKLLLNQIPSDPKSFKILLSGHWDIEDVDLNSLFTKILKSGTPEFVSILIDAGLINENWTIQAIKKNNLSIFRILWNYVEHYSIDADKALIAALESGNKIISKTLLRDFDLDFSDLEYIYDVAGTDADPEIFKLIVTDPRLSDNAEFLSMIIGNADPEKLKIFLEYSDAEITFDDLEFAATIGSTEIFDIVYKASQISPGDENNQILKSIINVEGLELMVDHLIRFPDVLVYAITDSELDSYTTPLLRKLLKNSKNPQDEVMLYWEEPLHARPGTMKYLAFHKILKGL